MDELEEAASDLIVLVDNKTLLEDFLYTSIPDALAEMNRRREDKVLVKHVEDYLDNTIPPHLAREAHAVLARHITTPNYELSRFLNVPDSTGLPPLFFEYLHDKLIYKNPFKYYLGKLLFYIGTGKKGGMKLESLAVIDFNSSHGKPISEVSTLWGEPLVDFHHGMFLARYPQFKDHIYDASDWYAVQGKVPANYYKKFLALFICHGILFENFLTDAKEIDFTRQIVLPAFAEVWKEFGLKPLVVALEPTHIEEDVFWYSHPHEMKAQVSGRIKA